MTWNFLGVNQKGAIFFESVAPKRLMTIFTYQIKPNTIEINCYHQYFLHHNARNFGLAGEVPWNNIPLNDQQERICPPQKSQLLEQLKPFWKNEWGQGLCRAALEGNQAARIVWQYMEGK